MSAITDFAIAMQNFGLEPDGIIPDGKIHRFQVGDKRNLNGWYVLFDDGQHAGGAFGNWQEINEKWTSRNFLNASHETREEWETRIADARRSAEETRKANAIKAAVEANELWNKATPAVAHPYLTRKKVKPFGLKVSGKTLLVPCAGPDGKIKALQHIYPDGSKFFMPKGASMGGNSFTIPGATDSVLVCEGYSTGASLHQATGCTVVCAYNAGNLLAVLPGVKQRYPASKIIVAGDDDAHLKSNVGKLKAEHAAKVCGVHVVFPAFSGARNARTDFNDLAVTEGLSVVSRQVLGAKKEDVKKTVENWAKSGGGDGWFTVAELDREFGWTTPEQKQRRERAVQELVAAFVLEPSPQSKTKYRVRNYDEETIDIFAPNDGPTYDAILPLGLTGRLDLAPRNIVVLAGESNTGKTAILLNTLMENKEYFAEMDNPKHLSYFSSEMSGPELVKRLDGFGVPREFWKGIDFVNKSFDFNNLIFKDERRRAGVNFVDYLEPKEADFTTLGSDLQKIYAAMTTGITFVAMQKKTGTDIARGGELTKEKARLYISVSHVFKSPHGEVCEAKIIKCKFSKGENMNGQRMFFLIQGGAQLETLAPWQFCSQEQANQLIVDLKAIVGESMPGGGAMLQPGLREMFSRKIH